MIGQAKHQVTAINSPPLAQKCRFNSVYLLCTACQSGYRRVPMRLHHYLAHKFPPYPTCVCVSVPSSIRSCVHHLKLTHITHKAHIVHESNWQVYYLFGFGRTVTLARIVFWGLLASFHPGLQTGRMHILVEMSVFVCVCLEGGLYENINELHTWRYISVSAHNAHTNRQIGFCDAQPVTLKTTVKPVLTNTTHTHSEKVSAIGNIIHSIFCLKSLWQFYSSCGCVCVCILYVWQ